MHRTDRRGWTLLLLSVAVMAAAACERPTEVSQQPHPFARPMAAVVPSQDDPTLLDIATWNVEWFGNTGFGPTNEALQLQNVRDVMSGANIDLWGLQEVCDTVQFRQLVNGLPGYASLVANDPSVVNGPQYYSDFSNTEQKVAIVYRTSVVSVLSAKVILTANDYEFAGRPPVEFKLRITLNGLTQDAIVIVLHAKSGADTDSYNRRLAGSNALKTYLDTTYPTQKVWIIGDINDDVDTSILAGSPSPYANFVNDAARYSFPSKALSDAHIASTVSYPDVVDHQLNTNETYSTYVSGSVHVLRADNYIANYGTTTSDHYAVLARYTWAPAGANTPPTASFTSSCTNLSCTFTDASTDADGTVTAWSWNFGDASTSTVRNPTHTYAAAGTYTVALTVTDNAGATSSTSQALTVTSGGSAGKVIINEILANEPGSNTAGEAVELVNIGGAAVDISGWTVSDATATRHTFAAGTSLPAGKSISVYGKASAIPAGVTAVGASTGQLNLSNSGDSVILKDKSAVVINQFTYGSSLASQDGVSMNRSPDGSATGTFVLHNTISTLKQSIGYRATGAAW